MLHLFNTAVHPRIALARALRQWSRIARGLSEPPRRRQYQLEKLGSSIHLS
jgi:hypothetical protein